MHVAVPAAPAPATPALETPSAPRRVHLDRIAAALARVDRGLARVAIDAATRHPEPDPRGDRRRQLARRAEALHGTRDALVVALQRLELDPEGFGRCLRCRRPIEPVRLEIRPHASRCEACALTD